jgi:uncharacterized protein
MSRMPVSAKSVFAVPVMDRWLVTAPLAGVSACMNRRAVAALASEADPLPLNLEPLRCLRGRDVEPPAMRHGPVSPQFLGLICTRSCNLNCRYCNFGASVAPAREMDPHAAVAAIDWMAEMASREGRSTLDVHLFGGEPLLAADVVDVIVHRTRIAAAGRAIEPVLEAATNGACSEARARFAGDYLSTVVLSLDGPAPIHDLHRPFRNGTSSFAVVERTARILRDSRADLCLRVCVSQHNVETLAAIASWMAREFRPSTIDFEPLQPTAESEFAGLQPPNPYEFAAAFLAAVRAAASWGVKATFCGAVHEQPRNSFCPMGNDAVIVDVDGTVNACYLNEREWQAAALDLKIGSIVDRRVELDETAVARVRAVAGPQERCSRCLCRHWCAGGCRVRHGAGGGYDDYCVETRLITIACLLEELGAAPVATALLDDRRAAESIALRASDCLEDWCEPHH